MTEATLDYVFYCERVCPASYCLSPHLSRRVTVFLNVPQSMTRLSFHYAHLMITYSLVLKRLRPSRCAFLTMISMAMLTWLPNL